jgi:HTH-type transcriptional regulator/antitoxin HigA
MITNEVQHRATRAHLAKFEEAIANLERQAAGAGDKKRRALELGALRSQASDLEAELAEYELLRSGKLTSFEAHSLAQLADALVKARIAKGWTQRQLADALGVAEQQIQRYESTGYGAASLARLCDIADALGTEVREVVSLSPDGA